LEDSVMARYGTITEGETVVDKAQVPRVRSTSRGLRGVLISAVAAAAVCGCSAPTAADEPTAMTVSIPIQVENLVKMGADHLQARVLNVSPLSFTTASHEPFGPSKYETVTYEVTNPTPNEELFMPRLQALVADHQSFSPDTDATIAIGQALTPQVIGPGTTTRCKIAFVIPQSAKNLEVGITNTEGIQWRVGAH
jgi:hypothetical protein